MLHQALEDARDLATLQAFCSAHACTSKDVSGDDKRLDMLRVFDLMRSRGYGVSKPVRPQAQPRKGYTVWVVEVSLPDGPTAQLAFYTPNTS